MRNVCLLTFREEHKIQMSENKVITKISGPRDDEVNNLG